MDDDEILLNGWRWNWIDERLRHSQQPLDFWQAVVDALIEGRRALRRNPTVPVGNYVSFWPTALKMLVDRNNQGIALEKSGNLEAAITIYEISIGDEFTGTQPYDRLRILYTRRAWYKDAIRVCQAYVSLATRLGVGDHERFRDYALKLGGKFRGHGLKRVE